MDGKENARQRFGKLPVSKKIQLITAAVVTVALLFALPAFAWLNFQRRIVKIQKIDTPNPLFLSAAHREDSVCFEIDGIDADEVFVDGYGSPILDAHGDEQNISYKDYVFSVTGEAVGKFTIQLAYTTNNAFTFEVYAADELTERPAIASGVPVDFVTYTLTGRTVDGMPELTAAKYHPDAEASDVLYYRINRSISENQAVIGSGGVYVGRYLNSTDGTAADDDALGIYLDKAYGTYGNVQSDAMAVYWQARNVSAFPGESNPNKVAFSRHFILRIKWEPGTLNNSAKETDIVYIAVKATG